MYFTAPLMNTYHTQVAWYDNSHIHLNRDWKRPRKSFLCVLRLIFRIHACTNRCQATFPDTEWLDENFCVFICTLCKLAVISRHTLLPIHNYSPSTTCYTKRKWPKLGAKGTHSKGIKMSSNMVFRLLPRK